MPQHRQRQKPPRVPRRKHDGVRVFFASSSPTALSQLPTTFSGERLARSLRRTICVPSSSASSSPTHVPSWRMGGHTAPYPQTSHTMRLSSVGVVDVGVGVVGVVVGVGVGVVVGMGVTVAVVGVGVDVGVGVTMAASTGVATAPPIPSAGANAPSGTVFTM